MSVRTLIDLNTNKEMLVFEEDREGVTPTQATIDNLTNKITALEGTVGDSTDGLVKDVADLQTDVSSLQADVGDETDGLIKDVNDLLEETETIKNDVDELGDDVSGIQEKIPDDATGTNQLMTESGVETRLSYLKTLPPYPTDDGVYRLQVEISDGEATLTWVEVE